MFDGVFRRIRLAAGIAFLACGVAAVQAQNAGELDPTFGVQGRTIKTIPNPNPQSQPYNSPEDMVIQPDGKIVVAGYAFDSMDGMDFFVVRFNPDGSVDNAFGSNGIFRYDHDGGSDECYGVALQADGKIVIVGSVQINPFNPEPNTAWAIIRLSTAGAFDSTFGTGGLVLTDHMLSLDEATEIAIQPDQRILVSGWSTRANPNNTAYDFAVARYLPSGALDTTFGTGGITYTDFAGRGDLAQASVLQPDGRLIVAGNVSIEPGEDYDFGVVRYNTDGTLDATFGSGGRVTTRFLVAGSNELARGVALAPDGRIVVTGEIKYPIVPGPGSHSDVATARYLQNGSLDASFNTDGRFIYDSGAGDRNEDSYDVVVQGDGKPVLVGKSRLIQEQIAGIGSVGHVDFLLIRLDLSGNLDGSFGTGGLVRTDFGIFNPAPLGTTRTGDRGRALLLQSDGRIVGAGLAAAIDNANAPGRPGGNGDPTIDGHLDGRLVLVRYLNDIAAPRTPFDFDGDGKTDLSIFRPSPTSAEWWYQRSSDGSNRAFVFGTDADRIAPADFTGDGKTDIAFFRPASGQWFVLRSEDSSFYSFPFGINGDYAVPADFDVDGKADPAVFRPASATWYINKSTGGTEILTFGSAGDVPVVADYDGDARADLAIYRANASGGGQWWIRRSSNGSVFAMVFGSSTDRTVQGNYTGDGKADVAFWRPATGSWFVLRSEDFSFYSFPFGANGDMPVPGDYDGDGRNDAAVFRPSSATWFANKSSGGTLIQAFGTPGDTPIPSVNVR